MSDPVLVQVADGVATLTLNRPQVMNAMDGALMARLREAASPFVVSPRGQVHFVGQ